MTMAMPLSLETAEYEFLVSPLTSVQGHATEPATRSVKVRFGAVSDAGRVRPRNHPDQAPVDSTSEYPLPTEGFSALK
jgi:hypothetical protein